MSHWNYRVILKAGTYGIHEVFYDDAGKPIDVGDSPQVLGMLETLEYLKGDLELMNKAFDKAVLEFFSLKEVE